MGSASIKDKKLGIGIIGTGAIVETHIKSVQDLDCCTLVALSSSSRDRARLAEEKYNIPTYSSYRDLVKQKDIDAVIIGTLSGDHLNPTLAAAREKKHVLVEKPLEINLHRARQMVLACEKADVRLACIFQSRFSEEYLQVKKTVHQGKLGKLYMGNAYVKWFRPPAYYQSSKWKGTLSGDGGAALINQGIHTIDLLIDLMGEAASVFGKIKTVRHRIEGEDLGAALITFQNGAMGTIEASTAISPGFPERLEVFGEKGSIILEGGKIIHWLVEGQDPPQLSETSDKSTGASDPSAIGYLLHKKQIKNFVEAILTNQPPMISGKEGLKALKVVRAIYASSHQGKEIRLSEL